MQDIKTEINRTQGEKHWLACPHCNKPTLHVILVSAEAMENYYEDGGPGQFWCVNDCQVVQCEGCKTLSFRKTYVDIDTPEQIPQEELYPIRISGRHQLPDLHHVPQQVLGIYRETLTALGNNLLILAGVGIRSLVEAVCKERKTGKANLEGSIDALVSQGVLTKDGAEILHSLRLMGNKAVHEVTPHNIDDLQVALDVVEHLLQGVYILPKIVSNLPKRKP